MKAMVPSILKAEGRGAIIQRLSCVFFIFIGALICLEARGQSKTAAPPEAASPAAPPASSSLSLRELLAEAEQNNPEIAAAAHGWQAGSHVAQQVSALPDTQWMVQQFAVGSPRPFAGFSNSDFAYIGFGVAQEFPYPGKRGLRAGVAQRETDSLRAQADLLRTQIAEKLKTSYYELAYFQQSMKVLQENDQLLATIEQAAESRYRAGQGSQQEMLKAQLQHTKILQEVTARRGSIHRLEAVLKQLLGRPQDSTDIIAEPLRARPLSRRFDEFGLRAREQNPAVLVGHSMLKKTESQTALARREFRPDFSVQYMYQHTGSAFRDYYMATVGITLPNRRRRNAELAEATERQAQAGSQLETERQRALAEVRGEYARAETSAGQLKIYEEGLLPQSEAVFQSALAAYQSNRQDFQSLYSSWLDRLEMELQYQHELLEHESALARLEALTGVTIQ